jgi:hypothetical protein
MRRWAVIAAACLAIAVAIPSGWWITRTPDREGVPVVAEPVSTASSGRTPAGTSSLPASARGDPATPTIGVRPAAPPVAAPVAVPVRLQVRSAGIDVPVDPMGAEPDGTMSLPTLVTRAGWYRFGPAPGDAGGSMVVAGHIDQRGQGLGAFARLRDVRVGDDIVIRTVDGTSWRYRVTGRNTVTCGGRYLRGAGGYQDNMVVVADPAAGGTG